MLYLVIKYRNRAIGTTKRKDPAFHEDPGWPLVGQLPTVIKNRARSLEEMTMRGLKYGPGHAITVPGVRMIDVSKPEWLEYIQKTNFDNYVKGPLFRNCMYDVFGDGIFVSDGQMWKRARHATSTIFTLKTFKTIIVPSSNKSMDELSQVLTSIAGRNHPIDFCDLFFRFTLDSFVHMTFGKDLGLLGIGYEDKGSNPFSVAFDYAQDQVDFRFVMPIGWRLIERLNIRSMGKRMKVSCGVLDDYAYSLIDERMSNLTSDPKKEKQATIHTDLLGLFMNARDERGGDLGRTELRDTTLNLIIAGRDTTAEVLSWSFFHLLMNEDLVLRIREEASGILGEEKRVTYENYKQFILAYAIVHETLRLHPSVPKDLKCVASDDQIPGGPRVEAGDMVRWSDWQMGRDASIWGPDCGEFKPDRWIDDEKGSIKQFGPYKFHAFNAGPRICLGMNLAIYQAVKVIVETFMSFELEFAPGWLENVPKSESIEGITSRYPTPMYRTSLTLPMDNPMMISVKKKKLPLVDM
ncbi:hypothetical protein MJO29_009808 [Puccinia striiformis f. sp. tritici]|nr:hypothetical protein MJO29_009808 [Puccinia striiformis f. sp. tritici]